MRRRKPSFSALPTTVASSTEPNLFVDGGFARI
jgi:hypothetical protein